MVAADILAAHALGELFFFNFSTVQNFCGFCNITKAQQNQEVPILHSILRTKNAVNITAINDNPHLPYLYGTNVNSILNNVNYFHVANGFPSD